jgi:hypothetical protein
MTINLDEESYATICRVAKTRNCSKKAAIQHICESVENAPRTHQERTENAPETHRKRTENAPKSHKPRERASSPSAQKENNKYNTITETAGFDASRISSFSSLENNKENSKKAPPDFLPDDWEPPKEFQKSWCIKREYCYETALDIFKSKFKADPQRCADWDSKWRFFLLNGYLKGAKFSELAKEEDSYGLAIGMWQPNFTQTGLPPRNDL